VIVHIMTYERSTLLNREKYIGLDVHQATISVAVMDSKGTLVMESILETKASTIVWKNSLMEQDSGSPGAIPRSGPDTNCRNILWSLVPATNARVRHLPRRRVERGCPDGKGPPGHALT
jgi:hypothetical protein